MWIGIGIAVYALIELVEAVGLWGMWRWGEYFAVVATGIFLPLEIYELTEKVTTLRVAMLLVTALGSPLDGAWAIADGRLGDHYAEFLTTWRQT